MITEMVETTVWDCNQSNHTYYIDDGDRVVAYRMADTGKLVKFATPLKNFSTKYRKFKKTKLDKLPEA